MKVYANHKIEKVISERAFYDLVEIHYNNAMEETPFEFWLNDHYTANEIWNEAESSDMAWAFARIRDEYEKDMWQSAEDIMFDYEGWKKVEIES